MELSEAIVDRRVVYTPFKGCPLSMKESGVITSVNSKFIFVRYGNDVNSKATDPEDLEYETGVTYK
jgi:hypothetical protein